MEQVSLDYHLRVYSYSYERGSLVGNADRSKKWLQRRQVDAEVILPFVFIHIL